MTDQDKDRDEQQNESQQQKQDRLRSHAKALKNQGFNDEQISQQLSSKFQMTTADVKNVLDQDQAQNKEDKS